MMLNIRSAILAAVIGGLIAGTVDIGAAMTIFQAPASAILKAIASGWVGRPAARAGGTDIILLGLFFQEFISIVAALVYCLASTRLPMLTRQWLLCGLAFGFAVNLFMAFIVVPLSRTHGVPIGSWYFFANLAANTVLFGPPIAFVAQWFAKRR